MGVYLIGVHLMGVYLIGVYLMGVHLTGVYLTQACISRRRESKEVPGLSAWLRSNDINCLGDISGATGASRARVYDERA